MPHTPPVDRLARSAQRLEQLQRQRLVRQHAVAIAAEIAAVGYTQQEAALITLTDRTLRQWQHNLDQAIVSIPAPARARRAAGTFPNAIAASSTR